MNENLERWRSALKRRGIKDSHSRIEEVKINEREAGGAGEDTSSRYSSLNIQAQKFRAMGSVEKRLRKECRLDGEECMELTVIEE